MVAADLAAGGLRGGGRLFFETLTAGCGSPPRQLLELGSGGGHVASHLGGCAEVTLVDLSPQMLEASRRLNPACEHVQGDMRELRLGRQFDAVLVHDAIDYMTSRQDLDRAIATARDHLRAGGAALFVPDYVAETFAPGHQTGGTDRGDRGVRFLEWTHPVAEGQDTYAVDFCFLLRDGDRVRSVHDRHVHGLFSAATWLALLAEQKMPARAVEMPHNPAGTPAFLAIR